MNLSFKVVSGTVASDAIDSVEITDQQPPGYVCCFQFLDVGVKSNIEQHSATLSLDPASPESS